MLNQSGCYQLRWPQLPLAVYREIEAHLSQVAGVRVSLLSPAPGQPFDYLASQVGALQVETPSDLDAESCQRLEEILAYYSQRFGMPEEGCRV